MSKLVALRRYMCYEKKYACLIDRGVENLVAFNPEHIVKIHPRKSLKDGETFCSSDYYCEVITSNGGSESVEGTLSEVMYQLSSPK